MYIWDSLLRDICVDGRMEYQLHGRIGPKVVVVVVMGGGWMDGV